MPANLPAWRCPGPTRRELLQAVALGCCGLSHPPRGAFLAIIACLLGPLAAPAAEPMLLIQGGSVFDPVSATWQRGRTIVIEGDKIKAVGTPEQPVEIPQGVVRILDAKGKFIVPGLIDAHVHLVHRLNFAHVTGDEILPLFLLHGVTTVRDTGDEIVAQTLVARHAEANPHLCPRVFRCSGLIDGNPPIHRDIGIGVSDPLQVKRLIDDMAAWGVTTVKIYAGTGRGVGRSVIEEGHRRDKVVTGHLSSYAAPEAVADGIDCLEHITSVFDFVIPREVRQQADHRSRVDLDNPQAKSLIALLAKRQVMVNPTLTVFRNMLLLSELDEVRNHPDVALVPERLRSYWHSFWPGQSPTTRDRRRKEFQKYQELVGLLYRAGVPLLAGTDAPEPFCPPGAGLHQELELLVESGLTPAAALQAATLNNARALKQQEQLGSLEVGKLADLIVLSADPLADIRNTRKIEWVVRGGRVCDLQALAKAIPHR